MQCFKSMLGVHKLFATFTILFHVSIVNGRSPKLSLVKNYNANDPALYKEFDKLLSQYQPLNFGVGYPDFNPPGILQNALVKAAASDDYKLSQYAVFGHPRLLKAIATFYSMLLRRTLRPDKNVAITVGASESLDNIFHAHTVPGDEWIIFEPCYPTYISQIKAVHGVPRYIPLISTRTTGDIASADFKFDKQDLANLFNNKTKGIVVNTPHNPTGKLFDYEELAYIAELAQKWDVIVVFDEVYQFSNYDNVEHLRIATFPGMFDRTISVGSAGKMFGITGYRIGWAYGPEDFVENIKTVGLIGVVSAPMPSQEAVAVAIEEEIKNYGKPDSFIATFRRDCEAKRNYIYNILRDAGMTPVLAAGGYYTIANWTSMPGAAVIYTETNVYPDYAFTKSSIKTMNFYALPLSANYGDGHKHIGRDYVRFTMIKSNETLEELERSLKEWKSKRNHV